MPFTTVSAFAFLPSSGSLKALCVRDEKFYITLKGELFGFCIVHTFRQRLNPTAGALLCCECLCDVAEALEGVGQSV